LHVEDFSDAAVFEEYYWHDVWVHVYVVGGAVDADSLAEETRNVEMVFRQCRIRPHFYSVRQIPGEPLGENSVLDDYTEWNALTASQSSDESLDIHAYYVADIGVHDSPRGSAFPPKRPTMDWERCGIAINAQSRTPFTLAHEVGHMLQELHLDELTPAMEKAGMTIDEAGHVIENQWENLMRGNRALGGKSLAENSRMFRLTEEQCKVMRKANFIGRLPRRRY